jgi:hypothetical protein
MKFEISEILPAKDPDEVLDILEAELSEVSDRVARSANQINAGRMRGASLGAINRATSMFIARANGHQVCFSSPDWTIALRSVFGAAFPFWFLLHLAG